jgi:exopolyphosphatase/guanosine-5'-triphosphate,3'-diphosphate pyrophosphatase
MADEARKNEVRAIAAVGTAGLRIARNREAVLAAIREATGVSVKVIPGEEEARLAYLAVAAWLGHGADSVVVFDTGGGSSQFTFGRASGIDERFSVDVGAVRYTERFGLASAVTPAVIREVLTSLAADFGRLDGRPRPKALVGMGGAVTNIAAVMHGLAAYDADVVQGTVLQRDEVDRQIALYAARDADGRRSIVGLQPERSDVILAGACIVRSVMEKLGAESLTVSDRGLRHGVLIERFGS